MFDINAIINNAIATAVAEATKPLVERIDTLEKNEGYLVKRIHALENIAAEYSPTPAVVIDEAKMVEALNSQEWFWEKLQRRINDDVSRVEEAMDRHLERHDHDSYDEIASKVEDIDFDDLVKTDDINEAVRDAIGEMSFEVRIR